MYFCGPSDSRRREEGRLSLLFMFSHFLLSCYFSALSYCAKQNSCQRDNDLSVFIKYIGSEEHKESFWGSNRWSTVGRCRLIHLSS